MTDIVERLRDWDHLTVADAIRAAAEIERLRAALEEAAKVAWEHDDDVGAVIADAIRALKEKTHEPG